MVRRLKQAVLAFAILSQLHCRDGGNPVEPPFKDPLTMIWTTDTISLSSTTYQTLMTSIWARSAQDVYIAGSTSSTSEVVAVFHGDGTTWHPVPLPNRSDIFLSITLHAITGNSSGEIWVAGAIDYFSPHVGGNLVDSTLVLHYDGASWRDLGLVSSGSLLSIYVSSSQDIWVCGRQGNLFHFDGGSWSRNSVPINVGSDVETIFSSVTGYPRGGIYLTGSTSYADINLNTTYFFVRKGESWSVADSEQSYGSSQRFGPYLWMDPAGSLYSSSPDIYKWDGVSWNHLHSSGGNLTSMFGINDQHLFAVGINGEVTYFNGTSWTDFNELAGQGTRYTGGWEDNSNVFIVGYTADGLKSIVLHGR